MGIEPDILRRLTRARAIVAGLLATALALALVAAACGGGGDEEEETPTAEPRAEASATPRAQATATAGAAEGETVTIDESFWHAGWKVTLGDATLQQDGRLLKVIIDAEFENLGEDDATFDSQLVLTAGGENYETSDLDEDLPRVPGGLKGKGTLAFTVDEAFTFDDALLLIGNTQNNQAQVPFSAGAGELVTLEPVTVAVTGDITAGALSVKVTGVEIRADLPERHSEVEKGKKVLIVKFAATPHAGIQIGQGVLQSPNVALKLPDGTAVAVRSDGVSGVNELLQGKEDTTISDLSVRFEVPDPVKGTYAFVVRGAYGPAGAQAEGELAIVVP